MCQVAEKAEKVQHFQRHRLCVAPMMDWTDRHCRVFHRRLTRRAVLYTEMVPTGAILFGDRARFLRFDPSEHPLALQLGGADGEALARAAAFGQAAGYDEINLNVGCPSDRVQNARFGACLMREPGLVAAAVRAIRAAVDLPVTVKTRIGVDDAEGFGFLARFVDEVAAAGCRTFVIHARKAWLSGLSPKQNREVPPLRYEVVHDLKAARPELEIIVNGGIRTTGEVRAQLARTDGVMIGREAYQNPWSLVALEGAVFGDDPAGPPSRHQVVLDLLPYVERECRAGTPLKAISRHLLGLFNGLPGGRRWRRHLSETAHAPGAGPETLLAALDLVPDPPARAAA
jgi:tRNA-dihydrouridine synthase A